MVQTLTLCRTDEDISIFTVLATVEGLAQVKDLISQNLLIPDSLYTVYHYIRTVDAIVEGFTYSQVLEIYAACANILSTLTLCKSTPSSVYEDMVRDSSANNVFIRKMVAGSPYIPESIFKKLMNDVCQEVRDTLFCNPRYPYLVVKLA